MPPVGHHGMVDYWNDEETSRVKLDCLFPTGVIVPLEIEGNAQLSNVKQALWKEAQNFPFYSQLKDRNTYVFKCITKNATKVELMDESRRFSDVRPFLPILQVIEKIGNEAEKKCNEQISRLIGKGLEHFESLKSPEVSDFRQRMRDMCESIAKDRDSKPYLEQVMCRYPPDIASDPQIPEHLREKLLNNMLQISIKMVDTDISYTVNFDWTYPAHDLVKVCLEKQAKNTGRNICLLDDYVLKVCGHEEYFLGNYPISQYLYIRELVVKGVKPELLLVRQNSIHDEPPRVPPRGPLTNRKSNSSLLPLPPAVPAPNQKSGEDSWDIKENVTLQINKVTNVGLADHTKLYLRACIYHGGELMCSVENVPDVTLNDGYANWNQSITFDIQVCNVPRMARICFLLYTFHDRRSKAARIPTGGMPKKVRHGGHEYIALAWVNMAMFDYRGVLSAGNHLLYLWPITNDDYLTEELLNPIGTVEYNPQVHDAVCLSITYQNYSKMGRVVYPQLDRVIEVAAGEQERSPMMKNIHPNLLDQLLGVLEQDPLDGLQFEQDQFLWRLRYECVHQFPQSLPKLLRCVDWNNYIAVAEMQSFLQVWKPLPAIQALELLDFAYADKSVRSFAVKCITDLSDAELQQYLLQLVQVLKYESYFECDLVEFLLNRALYNSKIGHNLFWLLRSEMHVPSVSVQFGLILEAYCRGNLTNLSRLTQQVEALDKLQIVSSTCKQFKMKKEEGKEKMRDKLNQDQNLYSDLISMMDPRQRLLKLRLSECSYMDSKMRPLKLVWENGDKYGQNIYMMYKQGDDLRQDMLTLQILKIMDNIWQSEGLDLRLNAYGCLSTGNCEGLIELVTEASTIANIQKEHSSSDLRSAFNRQCLYQWLETHNKDETSLNDAVDQFTKSCAGYCVATYVLGVGDRHSDNIMLRKNGQLFHIDFGHILGNFKHKFGFKRERVPFILTTDFVYVIKGGPKTKSEESFAKFRKMCEKAYMILRERRNFLISLFMMMMNTGIPEISSIKNIEYLRETLVPQMSDDDAIVHFRSKFQEALKNSFWAKMNNAFHNAARDNA